jgi:hypothetical protein
MKNRDIHRKRDQFFMLLFNIRELLFLKTKAGTTLHVHKQPVKKIRVGAEKLFCLVFSSAKLFTDLASK